MGIRRALRDAAPGAYARLSRGRRAIRLLREVRQSDADIHLIKDVLRKAGGTSRKECPLCGFGGRFLAFGSPPRWDAQCPSCGSLERHRHLALVIRDTPVTGAVLHFAPEDSVTRLLRESSARYTSADLHRSDVDVHLDIEHLAIRDGVIDFAVCSHVLEHVNDRAALSELYRVLRSGGRLILMVPLAEGCPHTYENPAVTSPRDREVHFGQSDHLRVYGSDFAGRVREAGFDVDARVAFGSDAVKYGLVMGEKVFVCQKRNVAGAS